MGDNGLVVPKQYRHRGTRIIPLPALSAAEGRPAFAQIRALRGRQFYLLVQRPGFKGFKKPKEATEEELAKLGVEASDHSRAIVLPGTVRVLMPGEPFEAYQVVDKPAGEHEPEEISVDALELDFPALGTAIMELSVPRGAEAGAPPGFPGGGAGVAGDPGPAGEAVRAPAQ
jgi:hypothetical protein